MAKPKFVYLLGPAGSGKSTLLSPLSELLGQQRKTLSLNLDPGADWLPYTPEIDLRTRITLADVMERYRLGPNGALLASVNLTLNYLPEFEELISAWKPDCVLVDTPGQLELFAFRETGTRIVKGLGGKAALLFLIDSFFARSPTDFISMLMLAASVHARFGLPQLNVLTKIDLLQPEELERVVRWTEDPDYLSSEVEEEARGIRREMARGLLSSLSSVGMPGTLQLISSLKNEGMVELLASIERLFGAETELDLGEEGYRGQE